MACLIIDNCVVSRIFFGGATDPDYGSLYSRIFSGTNNVRVVIAYGGKLLREYQGSPELVRRLNELGRGGMQWLTTARSLTRKLTSS